MNKFCAYAYSKKLISCSRALPYTETLEQIILYSSASLELN
jgi:hypothetical protein